MNPLFSAYAQSDFFGKLIFLALLGLSIVTWALLLYKWREQRQAGKTAATFEQLFRAHKQAPLALPPSLGGPFERLYEQFKRAAVEVLQKNRAVLQGSVTLSTADMGHVEGQLMMAVSYLSRAYDRYLFLFSTIVTLAPFLGLLGTVWGILLTFAELQKGGSVSANTTIMGGLAMALGTTVVGLVVAIPALLAYNMLKNGVGRLQAQMEDFACEMLATLELQYRKVEE